MDEPAGRAVIALGINPIVFAPGYGGAPSTARPLAHLRGVMTSYEQSEAAIGGYESCTISFPSTPEAARFWLSQLMASLVVSGPDASVIWEGALSGVEVQIGQMTRGLSLDGLANRVRARYTDVLGVNQTTPWYEDLPSIARYGTRELVVGLGDTNRAPAQNAAQKELARRKTPQKSSSTSIGTGDQQAATVNLTFTGWYFLLDAATANYSADTSTVITTELAKSLLLAYNVTNPFHRVATTADFIDVIDSGLLASQAVAPDTTYRAALEGWLSKGDSTFERLIWGIGRRRRFYVKRWAGASPEVIHYRGKRGSPYITNASGAVVPPWLVRPDTMFVNTDMLQSGQPGTDSLARDYVERVTLHVDSSGYTVGLEPQGGDGVDVFLARLGG